MPELYYTLADTSASAINIARWVKDRIGDKLALNECLMIAHALQRGERWQPPYYDVHERNATGPCNLVIIPDEKLQALTLERELALWELQKRGAEGDAEAAISFCKAIAAGELELT